MPTLAPTPDSVMLLGIRATSLESADAGVPRQGWVLRVLVEQLIDQLPAGSPSRRAVKRFAQPGVGVTDRGLSRALEHLADGGYLVPRGVGQTAAWTINPAKEPEVDEMLNMLAADERAAMTNAGQRALAISLAWSKTFSA